MIFSVLSLFVLVLVLVLLFFIFILFLIAFLLCFVGFLRCFFDSLCRIVCCCVWKKCQYLPFEINRFFAHKFVNHSVISSGVKIAKFRMKINFLRPKNIKKIAFNIYYIYHSPNWRKNNTYINAQYASCALGAWYGW